MGPQQVRRGQGRPRNSNSEETRAGILDAAIEAFAEGGFHGTGTRTVSDRAGVTPATVYYYFPNKRSLYAAAFQHSVDTAWKLYHEAALEKDSVIDEINAILECASEIVASRPAMTLLAIRAQTDLGHQELIQVLNRPDSSVRLVLSGMTRRAVSRGELDARDACDFKNIVTMFLWGFSIVGRPSSAQRSSCLAGLHRALTGTLIRPATSVAVPNPPMGRVG
jgi:AcrR family transcriptional regulator